MADEMDKSLSSEEKARGQDDQKTKAADAVAAAKPDAPEASVVSPKHEAGEAPGAGQSATAPHPKVDAPLAAAHETFPQATDREQESLAHRQDPPANPSHPTEPPSHDSVDDELLRPGLELLYDVELDATLQFGSKEMLLRDVLELGPGDVVELDRHIAEPVDLVVGDRIVARGEVVVASGNFALRVTEVATPQMRLESIRCLF